MVRLEEFVISQEQAREFARAVYADIEDYVKSHQQEFEEFLKEEGKEVISLSINNEKSL